MFALVRKASLSNGMYALFSALVIFLVRSSLSSGSLERVRSALSISISARIIGSLPTRMSASVMLLSCFSSMSSRSFAAFRACSICWLVNPSFEPTFTRPRLSVMKSSSSPIIPSPLARALICGGASFATPYSFLFFRSRSIFPFVARSRPS